MGSSLPPPPGMGGSLPPPPGMGGLPPPPGMGGGLPPPPGMGGLPPPPGMGGSLPPPPGMGGLPPPPGMGGLPPPPGLAPPSAMPTFSAPPVPQVVLPYKKKAVKPATKMRPLHWSKLDDKDIAPSIWNSLSDQDIKLDESVLESAFGLAAPKRAAEAEEGGAAARRPTVQSVQFVDAQRAQNISIALSRFKPLTYEAIRDATLAMDDAALPAERLVTLLKWLPQPEELESVMSYEGPAGQLGPVERYFSVIGQIPRLERRLEAWLYAQTFTASFGDIKSRVSVLVDAVSSLTKSKALLRVLEIVLAVGNYINGGSAKGSAYGFKLQFLTKLADIKSVDGSGTLLTHVIQLIDADPVASKVGEELGCVLEAARLDIPVLLGEVDKFDSSAKKAKAALTAAEASPTEADRFVPVMKEFVPTAVDKANEVKELASSVSTLFSEVCSKFAENPSTFKLPDALTLFAAFMSHLKRGRDELVAQTREKERKEKLRLAAEAKALAQGKVPGAAGAGVVGAAGTAPANAMAPPAPGKPPGAMAMPGMGTGMAAAIAAAAAGAAGGLKPVVPARPAGVGAGAGAGQSASSTSSTSPTEKTSPSAKTGDVPTGHEALDHDSGKHTLKAQVAATLKGGNSSEILKEINARRAARQGASGTRRVFVGSVGPGMMNISPSMLQRKGSIPAMEHGNISSHQG